MLRIWVVVAALQGAALAQGTGGSVGGGSFGGTSGGGAAGGGGAGVSSSDGDLGGPTRPDAWPGLVVLALAGVALPAVIALTRPRPRARRVPRDVRVAQLRVVIDQRGRSAVQRELAELARRADPSTREGRLRLLHGAALVLQRVWFGWVYGALDVDAATSVREARSAFSRREHDARRLFAIDRIRNDNGEVREEPIDHDAPVRHGLVVVTITVATRSALWDAEVVDAAALRDALRILGSLRPDGLVAASVVWSPADVDEPLDSIALEARVPGLTRLDDAVGAMQCAHCTGRYASEDLRCPHCGSHVGTHIAAAPATYTASTRPPA